MVSWSRDTSLAGNDLTDKGAMAIATALQSGTPLLWLWLRSECVDATLHGTMPFPLPSPLCIETDHVCCAFAIGNGGITDMAMVEAIVTNKCPQCRVSWG